MILNKIYALLLIMAVIRAGAAQTIISGGYVSGTWDSTGSPYLIEGPIYVHADSSLNILEGVTLAFSDSSFLEVMGMISAAGSPADSIYFTAREQSWQGIRIHDNDSLSGQYTGFLYCSFSKASTPAEKDDGGVLWVYGRENVGFYHCSFYGNYADDRGGAVYMTDCNAQMKYCEFSYNSTGTGMVPGTSKGGAVYMLNSVITLEYVGFRGNGAMVAGALYGDNSDFNIYDGSFLQNTSRAGGGAFVCHNGGQIVVDDTRFEFNVANGSGGAIAMLEAIWARFSNCVIRNNISQSGLYLADGGGVLITPYDNEVSFINCDISNNEAGDYGGGVYATSSTRFIGCLFHANQAALDSTGPGGGGAILFSLGNNLIMNSTLAENSGGQGTSILCEDANFSMINSILWDDTIGSSAKIYLSALLETPYVFVGHSNIEGGQGAVRGNGTYELDWASGNININPGFEIPGLYFGLSNQSPCIDTGRTDTLQVLIPARDINGNPRIYRGKIDMGCYENQFPFAITEVKMGEGLFIFPNPAGDYFYVVTPYSENMEGVLSLSDLSGRIVMSRDVRIPAGSRYRQDIFNLPSGMYILRFSNPEKVFTEKIIKM